MVRRTIGRPVLEYGAEVWIERDWKQAETKVVGMGRELLNGRRTLNAEVVCGELGLETLESRWNGARHRFWRKLLKGANPLAAWVYNKRREEFVLKVKKDKGNWCWDIQKLGMEEVASLLIHKHIPCSVRVPEYTTKRTYLGLANLSSGRRQLGLRGHTQRTILQG